MILLLAATLAIASPCEWPPELCSESQQEIRGPDSILCGPTADIEDDDPGLAFFTEGTLAERKAQLATFRRDGMACPLGYRQWEKDVCTEDDRLRTDHACYLAWRRQENM